MIALFVLASAYLIVPGGFYIDDFRAQAYAAGRGIWPFIIESNATHLAPGPRTMDWLQTTFWPLQRGPAVAFTLSACALLGVAVWRLLTQLVTRRWVALAGLGLALFAPSIIPAIAWYRQTLTTLTGLAFILVAIDAGLRYFRGAPKQWAYLAWAAHALGLCFSERAVVVPVTVAAAGLLLAPRVAPRLRLARQVLCVGPMVAVNLAFLALYGSGDYDHGGGGTPSVGGFLVATGRSLFVNTVPSLLGGPTRWRANGEAYSFARTPLWLIGLGVLGTLIVVATAWRTRRGRSANPLWRPLVVIATYVLPIYAILYVGRVSRADIASVDDLRLFPDVGIFVAMALALVVDAVVKAERRVVVRGLAAVAVLAVVAGSVSWVGFANRWHRNSSSTYVEALRTDLATNLAPVVPSPVPVTVVPNWVQPDFSTADLVALLHPTTKTVVFDSAPRLVGPHGRLVTGDLRRVDVAPDERQDFCRHALPAGQSSATINFTQAVPYYRGALLDLGVLVSDTTSITVKVADETGAVSSPRPSVTPQMQRGPHRVLLPIAPAVRVKSLQITRSRATADVCLTTVMVVQPPETP
ncbi:hypothetical protein ABEG17_18800 [Pedococcus sp. KACC 23699]|uniref:DUF6311 domain-containing protein n=1 Tax=Pedococcus sp. KACC 23699 TaxID=3149228 RepID=A0AAU7JTL6_9MICO